MPAYLWTSHRYSPAVADQLIAAAEGISAPDPHKLRTPCRTRLQSCDHFELDSSGVWSARQGSALVLTLDSLEKL